MSKAMAIATIFVVASVTAITRGLPYLVFRNRELPKTLKYIGDVFPSAIMVILVCYCLRNIDFSAYPYGFQEIFSIGIVVLFQFWRRNTILSIIVGTFCYMVLIRL